MEMLRCAGCGRAVSRHATSCPRCGVGLEPMSDGQYARARAAAEAVRAKDRRFTLLVLAAIGGLLLVAILLGPSREERQAAAEREFREHVESLPEQQRQRESDRFWGGLGMEKGGERR